MDGEESSVVDDVWVPKVSYSSVDELWQMSSSFFMLKLPAILLIDMDISEASH